MIMRISVVILGLIPVLLWPRWTGRRVLAARRQEDGEAV